MMPSFVFCFQELRTMALKGSVHWSGGGKKGILVNVNVRTVLKVKALLRTRRWALKGRAADQLEEEAAGGSYGRSEQGAKVVFKS